METLINILAAVAATGDLFTLGAFLHAIRHPKALLMSRYYTGCEMARLYSSNEEMTLVVFTG